MYIRDTKYRVDRVRGALGGLTMFATVVLLGTCFVAGRPAAAADDAGRQADAFIRRGLELRQAGDDDAAARQFKKAYDLARTPRAAAQLGLAEQALGRWEDAETHVTESLLTANDPWIAKHAPVLRQALTSIKEHVGRVEVVGEPEGAEVFVNGKSVGKAPLADPVHVRAGDVHVELRASGYARSSRSVNVRGGQYQSVIIRLEKELAVAPAASVASAAPTNGAVATGAAATNTGAGDGATPVATPEAPTGYPANDSGGRPFPLHAVAKWTAVGLSVGALALGVTATFIRYDKTSQFDKKVPGCSDVNGRAVYQDNPTQAAPECQGLLNAYRSARTWQMVGFIGTGVFGVTALVLALTHSEGAATAAAGGGTTALSRRRGPFDWVCTTTLANPGLACQARF